MDGINKRLNPAQIYALHRLRKGPVTIEELCTWDQRPLRGLYRRGYFVFDAVWNAWITERGLELEAESRAAKKRKNSEAPLFSGRHRSSTNRIMQLRAA